MIKQAIISNINSRSECNPYNKEGFLPLITAPMSSVVNASNYQVFLDNKIQVCLPRTEINIINQTGVFNSYSLQELKKEFNDPQLILLSPVYVCIDTANGNLKSLHDAIREAKKLHRDKLIIMSGNVASVKAFIELANTGCDYIRVGIGGGGGCNTTSNTGVGQEDLETLIWECCNATLVHCLKVKIVADGISSYIKQCEIKYGFNDNGYAAINKLIYSGADLVMIGKLFAQCIESAGEQMIDKDNILKVKYSGMSTHSEQINYSDIKKPSEGFVSWIPLRWYLNEWLNGSSNQDNYPYLMGWVNSIKSAMSYVGVKKLDEFINI